MSGIIQDVLPVYASYMRDTFQEPELVIERAKSFLEGVEYDTMVGTGLSGAVIAPMLAREFGKRCMIVRKENDESHSSLPVEGVLGKRWLFVDDFVSSGTTCARVIKAIRKLTNAYKFESEYVGAYLYHRGEFRPGFAPSGFGLPDMQPPEPKVDLDPRVPDDFVEVLKLLGLVV